jgi:hypothetical protein
MYYDVSSGAPSGECRPLDPLNMQVGGSAPLFALAADAVPGDFCFSTAGGQSSFTASASDVPFTTATTGASSVDLRDQAGVELNELSRDLWKDLFGDAGTSDGELFPFAISGSCPLVTALDDPGELAALRDFRDKVLSQHLSGIIFTFLFYRNAPELTRLLTRHEGLQEKVRVLVNEYRALLEDVSNGGTAYLQESDRSRVIELLEEIKTQGSPQLTADIDLVIDEIYAGTLGELCGIIIGD